MWPVGHPHKPASLLCRVSQKYLLTTFIYSRLKGKQLIGRKTHKTKTKNVLLILLEHFRERVLNITVRLYNSKVIFIQKCLCSFAVFFFYLLMWH